MMKKKKKGSPRTLRRILLIAIGMALLFLLSMFFFSSSISIMPASIKSVEAPQNLLLIYQIDNRLYQYNWETQASREFALLRGYDAEAWENIQVSPDGQYISYAASSAENEAHKDIFTQHIERGQVYNLSNTEHETETNYQWTADGRVVFATGGDILLSDATGQTINTVDLNYIAQNSLVTWSDEKENIVAWIASNRGDAIAYINTSAGKLSDWNYFYLEESHGAYSMTRLSPDGEWLAYVSLQPSIVYLTSATSRAAQQISDYSKEPYHLAWSENSEWLAYDSYLPDTDNWDIQLVHVETGQIQNLSSSLERDERYPVWLPNSTLLVQSNEGYGYFELGSGNPTFYDLPLPEEALFIKWLVQ